MRTRRHRRWPGRECGEARQARKQVASGRTGPEWFCHSIHIIMGFTLFYVGGGFIAGVSPPSPSLRVRKSSLSPDLLLSLFASLPLEYNPSSSVCHSASSPPRHNHIFRCSRALPVPVPALIGPGRVGLWNACRLRVRLLG
jgi:hypothetical protein